MIYYSDLPFEVHAKFGNGIFEMKLDHFKSKFDTLYYWTPYSAP